MEKSNNTKLFYQVYLKAFLAYLRTFFWILPTALIFSSNDPISETLIIIPKSFAESVNGIVAIFMFTLIVYETLYLIKNRKNSETKISSSDQYKFFKISAFLYSSKTQRDIFEPIVADWQEEYFEALFKKEIWKARWINVRYTYAFLAAMWQKSLIGDLIEFFSKLTK